MRLQNHKHQNIDIGKYNCIKKTMQYAYPCIPPHYIPHADDVQSKILSNHYVRFNIQLIQLRMYTQNYPQSHLSKLTRNLLTTGFKRMSQVYNSCMQECIHSLLDR